MQALILPDGEEFKTLDEIEKILDALVGARFARDCTVVALGGGVVGDMAGFAAACYQRGRCPYSGTDNPAVPGGLFSGRKDRRQSPARART